jgi:hypothetical protein
MAGEIIANPQQLQMVSDCLKTTSNFAESVIHNVCNGTVSIVPNGFWDYALASIGIGIVGLIGLMLLVFAIRIALD